MMYSFYTPDGVFTGQTYSGPEKYLDSATPPGCLSIQGRHDPVMSQVTLIDDGYGDGVPTVVPRIPDNAPVGYEWSWTELGGWELRETLAGARARCWAVLRDERDRREVAPVEVDGMRFQVDERSLSRISRSLQTAALSPRWSSDWTLADNRVESVSVLVLTRVLAAVAERGDTLHEQSRAVRARVNAAATIAEVEAITWPEEATNADA